MVYLTGMLFVFTVCLSAFSRLLAVFILGGKKLLACVSFIAIFYMMHICLPNGLNRSQELKRLIDSQNLRTVTIEVHSLLNYNQRYEFDFTSRA